MAYELPEGYTREMLNQVEQQERDLLPSITPLMDEPRESWRASNVSEDTFENWFAVFVAKLQIAWPERQRSDSRLARVPSFPLDSVPLVKTVWIAIAEFVCQFDMPLPSSAVPPRAYDTVCCLQCFSGLPSQHASHRCKPAPFTLCIVYRVLLFGRAWSDSGYSDKPMWTVTASDEPYDCVPMKIFRMALGLHQIELQNAFSATSLLQHNQAAKRERKLNLESEKLKHTNEQLRLAGVRDRRDCDESIQALRDELKELKDSFHQGLKMNVGGQENDLAAERTQTRALTEQLGRRQETDLAGSLEVGELSQYRQLFCTIICNHHEANALQLFEIHFVPLSDDVRRLLERTRPGVEPTENDIKDYCLLELEKGIRRIDAARTLSDFNLPAPSPGAQERLQAGNALVNEERDSDFGQMRETVECTLNASQKAVTEKISEREIGEPKVFFLQGPGGTGKPFVENNLLAKVRLAGKVALAVASNGIAALLSAPGATFSLGMRNMT